MIRIRLYFLLPLGLLACGDDGPREPAPATAAVTVGNDYFRSDRNGTENQAVDTVRAGGTVTWTWVELDGYHSVEPVGSDDFTPSDVITGQGSRYQVTFPAAGTYEYECGVHGAPMRGRIVVQ